MSRLSDYNKILFLIISGFVIFNQSIARGNKDYSKENLVGFPKTEYYLPDTSNVDSCFCDIAKDTWKFFDKSVDSKNGLITDKIVLNPESVAGYTSVTNIGLQMMAIISAMDFGFIDSSEAESKIRHILTIVQMFSTYYNGFLYNCYNLSTLHCAREYISSVDAAWFYSALKIVSVAFPELSKQCDQMTEQVDFGWLYDESCHHFYLGFDTENEEFLPYHYGMLCSESRICLYYGIITGAIQPGFWYYQEQTLPLEYDQEQLPQGDWKIVQGIRYFDGYYEYNGKKIVPFWGGALFEFFMPTLFVNELRLLPNGIGKNDCLAAKIHIDYALNRMNYPVWGMSPSSLPDSRYGEFGAPEIGGKKGGYKPGIISPNASILTVACDPEAVFKNLKKMLSKYPVYGEYGLYDAFDPVSGDVGEIYLALDQAMILISLDNYLNDSSISRRFEQIPGFERVKNLLNENRMF